MRIKVRTWQALTSAERMGALQNAVERTQQRWQKKNPPRQRWTNEKIRIQPHHTTGEAGR